VIKTKNLHVGAALNMLVVGYAEKIKFQKESFNYIYRGGRIVGESYYDKEEDIEYSDEWRGSPEYMLKEWLQGCALGWRVVK
jgi:hypothetical protein